MSISQLLNPTKSSPTIATPIRLRDWEGIKVHLIFSAGRLSPELFDLFLQWLGRRKEEPQICLLFWLATYNPPLFHLILGVRRYLLTPLQLIK